MPSVALLGHSASRFVLLLTPPGTQLYCCLYCVQYMTRDEVERLLEAAMVGLEDRMLAGQAEVQARQQAQQEQQQQAQQQQKGAPLAAAGGAAEEGAGALDGSAHSGAGSGLSAMQQRMSRVYAAGNGGGGGDGGAGMDALLLLLCSCLHRWPAAVHRPPAPSLPLTALPGSCCRLTPAAAAAFAESEEGTRHSRVSWADDAGSKP